MPPSFSAPTRTEYADNRLGEYGVGWQVGKVVYITTDDEAVETETFSDPDDLALMKAGSGDFGLALFRRGRTYTITSGEETILNGAGYTTS